MSARIAIATNLHHRMELDFFREWLDYHRHLGVHRIFVGVDARLSVGDRLSQHLVLGEQHASDRPYVWWKKPNFDYHDELTYGEVIERWQSTLSELDDDRVVTSFLRLPQDVNVRRQLRWLSMIYEEHGGSFDYLFFIDGDEFLVPTRHTTLAPVVEALDGTIPLHGIRQQLFDKRWASPGVNRRSVFDITATRGLRDEDNPAPANAFKCLFGPTYSALARTDLHPHGYVKEEAGPYATVPTSLLRLYHFRGWVDLSHRGGDGRTPAEHEVFEDQRHVDVFLHNLTATGDAPEG